MTLICLDYAVRPYGIYGITRAIKKRFELFDKEGIDYQLWTSIRDLDYLKVVGKEAVLSLYESYGIRPDCVRFPGIDMDYKGDINDLYNHYIDSSDTVLVERLDSPENILFTKEHDFNLGRLLHQEHLEIMSTEENIKVSEHIYNDKLDFLILVGDGQIDYIREPLKSKTIHIPVVSCAQVERCVKVPRPFGTIRMLTVSRLSEEKNILSLLKVMAALKFKQITKVHLDIYGSGDDFEKLKSIARVNRIEEIVNFKGYQSVIPYGDYDVYLTSSMTEAFGTSLYEALVNGLILIGLDVRYANQNYIHNGKNGWLVDPFNAVQYVNYIEKLLVFSENDWERFSNYSEKLAEMYQSGDIIVKWKDILQEKAKNF